MCVFEIAAFDVHVPFPNPDPFLLPFGGQRCFEVWGLGPVF